MPGIFSPDDIPAWMNPTRRILESDTAQAGINFSSAFRQANDQKFQRDMVRDEKKEQLLQQTVMAEKVSGMAEQLKGVSTPTAAWEVVSKNPQWLADPMTAPFVQNYLKAQTEVARSEINTIEGKTKLADLTDFTKRISTLAPEDRAAIKSMSANPDGSISAMQWQALGVSEQRQKLALENQRKAAEIEALSRGDVATTKITDKGVETTFRPATPEKDGAPKTMMIDGGVTLAWMPGGNTLHVIKPNGEKNELTAAQLSNIAKGLSNSDGRKSQILEFLANKAVGQTTNTTAPAISPSQPAPIKRYNPETGKIE